MKQYNPLTVKYVGKRGKEIDLYIEEFPDDDELIIAITDAAYKEEWKSAFLDSYYEESRNDQKESRRDRHTQLSTFNYESAEYFGVEDNIFEDLATEELYKELSSFLTKRQLYLVWRCLVDGDSYSEVAREEGKDESSIRQAVNRAKKKLKKHFKDHPNLTSQLANSRGKNPIKGLTFLTLGD